MNKKTEFHTAINFLSEATRLLAELRAKFIHGQEQVSCESNLYEFETELSERDRQNLDRIQQEKDLAFSRTIKQITAVMLMIEAMICDLQHDLLGKSLLMLLEEANERLQQIHHPIATTIGACLQHAKENLQS